MIRTFLDSGVLIAAYRGKPSEREAALVILDDVRRFFLSSRFLWLEVMPKAVYFRNEAEIEFYRIYFEKSVRVSLEALEDIGRVTQLAADEAQRCGLSAMDGASRGCGLPSECG